MTTNEDRTIRDVLGRMGDEAPPAPAPEDLDEPVVYRSGPGAAGTRPGRWTLAAVTGILVGALAVLAIILSSEEPVDEIVLVGEPVPASAAEFEAALAASLDELAASAGVEALERGFIGGHLANLTWASTRQGGDTATVQQADVDVRDTAWWVASSSPPRVGENIETTARVLVGGSYYEATATQDWSVAEPDQAPRGPLAFSVGLLQPEFRSDFLRMVAAPDGSEVTRQDTADGGEVWVLTYEADDIHARMRIRIHADGHLAELSQQAEDPDRHPAESGSPIDLALTSYRVLDDPGPLPEPEPDTPLDLDDFDLPDGFGFGR